MDRIERVEPFEAPTARTFALYRERRYGEALAVARDAGGRFPDRAARVTRWIAALQCIDGKPRAALQTLRAGRSRGRWWPPGALLDDPDFAALRGDPELAAIAAECACAPGWAGQ